MGRNNNRKTWDIPDEKLVHTIRGMVYNKLGDVSADKFTPPKLNYGKVSDLTDKFVQSKGGFTYNKVSDVADKFTHLKMSSGTQNLSGVLSPGGLHNRTDFLGRSCENPFGRSYSRKIAG